MKPLRRSLAEIAAHADRLLAGPTAEVSLGALAARSGLGGRLGALEGRSVLISTDAQLATAVALVELDGVARRIVLCPPDLKPDYLEGLVRQAGIEAVVTDRDPAAFAPTGVGEVVPIALPLDAACPDEGPGRATEWVLLTSGTTGAPKMVSHTREGLTGAIPPSAPDGHPVVWGTFYDIRRYGGLQILLRALLGGNTLVLSSPGEDVADHLARLARHGVTHQSGTPSHWRRVLMSDAAGLIDPDYVRLSGEIADQAILDALVKAYPRARIGHAYASTEAGVGFEVNDGREGFPADLLGRDGPVEMRVEDGSLRIRSPRAAGRYVGEVGEDLRDPGGWIDTDDMVERRGDRCFFVGRRSGIINVGGLKVHPEEVEAVINRHARVRMSLVKPRTNPITGAIVVADVVLYPAGTPEAGAVPPDAVKAEILALCRSELPQHKVPVLLRFIDRIAVTPAGKLARAHA